MKDMFDLTGKVCIITGAAGLIGSAYSKACVEHNAKIIAVDIDEKKGSDLVQKIKKETSKDDIIFQKGDINNLQDIQNLISLTVGKYGKIDALINNAFPRNKNYGAKFEDVAYKDFCENVDMHLGGYFLMTQQIAKQMIKQDFGNIINMASIYGFSAPKFEIYDGTNMTSAVEYAAIKGGVVQLTRYLASYLGKHNIRVNALSPGGVFDNQPESFVKKYSERVKLGKRMANPDDLVGTLIYLLSDASNYVTGQNIAVDGGWTL